ncbi:MAG: hypothetical protein SVK54_01905 [candidate division WOR-3 bacterium]|nr:hypothetical protein [candidate division WOR-3 bacterium]
MKSRMKVMRVIVLLGVLMAVSCSVLPWVKDVNNIQDWITLPNDGDEFRYSTRTRYYSDDTWHENAFTIEITDIENKSDAVLIETRYNDSSDRDYIIIDKEENAIAYSEDDYYDEDNDFIALKTPVSVGNDWYNNDYNFTIKEVNAQKDVEAGIYNDCIVVEYSDSPELGELWFSPSAGTYIYEEYTNGSGYQYITELERIRE